MFIGARVSAASFIVCALLTFQAKAATVTGPWIGGGSLTMNYTFTLGTTHDIFTVQSIAVTNDDPTSGYYGMFPEHTFFTGFTPLSDAT